MKQVRISSVNGKIATDEMGRNLTIAGNISVQSGDFVWTDGRIIYGNLQTYNKLGPFAFTRDDNSPGIPLNTAYGLLIYTRNHRIYRYTGQKQRRFVNNSSKYSVNSRLAYRGISDADISKEGKTWEINNANALYSEGIGVEWLYNGVNLANYWWPKNEIVFLMSVRDIPNTYFNWNIGNRQNTVEQVITENKTIDSPGRIYYNGEVAGQISLASFAQYGKTKVKSMLAQVQNSKFRSYVSCSATLSSTHIDEKGNWSGFVHISAGGSAYKDYEISMKIGTFNVRQIAFNNISYAATSIRGINTLNHTYTEEFRASYQGDWWIENGNMITPVFESEDFGPNEYSVNYIDAVDTRAVNKGTEAGGMLDPDNDALLNGIRFGTTSTKNSAHIELPNSYNKRENTCFVPVQDDFAFKSIEGMPMTDNTTVYKNGRKLFTHSGGISLVGTLNEEKGEYLFQGAGGIYVVRNGEINPVTWKGNPIYCGNWRLRYMQNIGDLRRDENKIP